MIKRLTFFLFGFALLGLLAIAPPAGAASTDGTVYVVHGIPGVPVDVYVNGTKTLSNFAPSTVAGPLSLPAGSYTIKIFKVGAAASTTPVIDSTVQLPAGANVSLVANLNASGQPTLSTFVNDVSAAPAGDGRLIVRHTAAAPAVDVLAGGQPVFKNLVNGQGNEANLPAGTVTASVVATGTTTPVLIGPAPVTVDAGMATVVYAVGAPASGGTASTLGVVSQQIPLASPTMSVQAGTGGLLDHHAGFPAWAFVVLAASVLGILGGGMSFAKNRARA
jgi:hypothetical protein